MYALRWPARLGGLVLALAAAGCGDAAPKTYPVQGTVTVDKKPLEKGTVYFKTVQTGAVEAFEVVNGEFRGQAEAGDRRVEVSALRVTKGDFGGMKGEVQENTIPKQYNVDSKLTAAVTPAGPNQFAFDLSSK